MKNIAGLLVLLGAGSFVLDLLNREFILLMWIDTWGVTTGNVIRIGMVVVGIVLWIVAARQENASTSQS